MPDEQSADLMMKLQLSGKDIIGEAMQWVDAKKDTTLEGFKPSPTPDEWSNFFEVQDFSFNMSVKPKDDTVGGQGKLEQKTTRNGVPIDNGSFRAFRIAGRDELKSKTLTFPVEFNSVKITRVIEASSPLLFYACVNNLTFSSASLVKRVSASTQGDKNTRQLGFLRFDFTDVLITSISWSDGDLVDESFDFICKQMDIAYYQQQSDGSLSTTKTPASWKQQRGAVGQQTSR